VARPDLRRRDVVQLGSGALLGRARVQRRGRGCRGGRRRRCVRDLLELLAHLLRDRVLVVGLAILDVAVKPFATAFKAEFDLPLVPRRVLVARVHVAHVVDDDLVLGDLGGAPAPARRVTHDALQRGSHSLKPSSGPRCCSRFFVQSNPDTTTRRATPC